MKYNRLPLKKIGITSTYEEHKNRGSYGQDFGWFDYEGEPVYSINDGTVMQVDKNSSCGNYIWIKHSYNDKKDLWSRYLHLKDKSTKVKVNQKVKRGEQIASMGNTGNSTGTHLHFEIWLVPKGWKFNWNDRSKYAVRGTDYVYLFDDQVKGSSSNNKVLNKVIGTSKQVKRDTNKNQIEVISQALRCRKGAGTNQTILGYIDLGIYNYIETKVSNNYTWYKLDNNMWIAGIKEYAKVYPKEEIVDNDKTIEELENYNQELVVEIDKLNTEIEQQKKVIEELTEKLNNYSETTKKVSNYKVFICPKDDTYAIELKKDEKLYKEA